jgi:hypothetical protein
VTRYVLAHAHLHRALVAEHSEEVRAAGAQQALRRHGLARRMSDFAATGFNNSKAREL